MKKASIFTAAILLIVLAFPIATFAADKSNVTIEGVKITNSAVSKTAGAYKITTNKEIVNVDSGQGKYVDVKLTIKATKSDVVPTPVDPTTPPDSPGTGDSGVSILLILALLASGAVAIFLRKKPNKATLLLALVIALSPIAAIAPSVSAAASPSATEATETTEMFTDEIMDSFIYDSIISNSGGTVTPVMEGTVKTIGLKWSGIGIDTEQTLVYRLALKTDVPDSSLGKELSISNTSAIFTDTKGKATAVTYPAKVSVKLSGVTMVTLTYHLNMYGSPPDTKTFEYPVGTVLGVSATERLQSGIPELWAPGDVYPWNFGAWNTEANGTGTVYSITYDTSSMPWVANGSTPLITLTNDLDLYAQWYTVN